MTEYLTGATVEQMSRDEVASSLKKVERSLVKEWSKHNRGSILEYL